MRQGKRKKYDKSFWLFVAVIIVTTIVILIINNYTTLSMKELSAGADTHIEVIEAELERIQKETEQYGRMIDQFVKESSMELLEEEIAVIQKQLKACSSLIKDTFFIKRKDANKEIKYGQWKQEEDPNNQETYLVYTRPIYNADEYVGYMEVWISQTAVQEEMAQLWENREWNYFLLMKEDAENFSENGKKIYTYQELRTGMFYIEEHDPLKRTHYSNEMIVLIGLFAIGAMWMIQPNGRSGKTWFDRIADFIMKNYKGELNSLKRQGNQATIALNLGMSIAIFADVGYSIALRRDMEVFIEYLLFFLVSSSVLVIYKYSKSGITEQMASSIILLGFICSMAEHIATGGFQAGRVGESFLWFLVCLYYGLFILGTAKSGYVFKIYTVLLFLDILLEMILQQNSDYEANYLFAIGFILLGFALYIAMEIYVTNAAGHYNKKKELIEEIKTNQALLMQKEKLSSLGQLISSVSYEINTPIGAIKASAETMESMLTTIMEEILDGAEAFAKEEYDAFQEIAIIAMQSMGKMQSTIEVKKAKKQVVEYFNEIGLAHGNEIGYYLGQLEIVDLQLIKERVELFRMEHIIEILEKVTKLTAFTTGIPTVIHASDSVSKIVLALKSYVYTNGMNEQFEFNLAENIENVLVLYHNQIKGRINVIKNYESRYPMVKGSPDELSQVWTNLIQNAIQAMKGGGELTIGIKDIDEEYLEVAIGDTGGGIPPELMSRIYEPFFTTKMSEGVNGLGLSITKRVIDKHHGELRVENRIGQGCIFHILLKKR